MTTMTTPGFSDTASPTLVAAVIDDTGMLASLLGIERERAAKLITPFGSLAETIAAPVERLAEIGARPQLIARIKMLHAAVTRVLQAEVRRRPALSSWTAVTDYLRVAMAFETIEQFRVLFLDKRNHLIADEVQQQGTVDHTPVYPREVAKRSLELGAVALLIVHNHPSGDLTPSRADIDMTKLLVEALKPLGIAVHDHIIISRDGHVSMKAMGLF